MQNGLDLGLGASDISELADRDAQSTSEQAAQMRRRVGKLVGLAISLVEGDEDTHIVFTRKNLYRGACKFGSDLVEAAGCDALFRTGDVEGAHGRVMRCLFGEIRNTDEFFVLCSAMLRHRKRDVRSVLAAFS